MGSSTRRALRRALIDQSVIDYVVNCKAVIDRATAKIANGSYMKGDLYFESFAWLFELRDVVPDEAVKASLDEFRNNYESLSAVWSPIIHHEVSTIELCGQR